MSDLLVLDDVVAGYGHAPVLHGVQLAVREGEIAVVLGGNGVGKTTTLRTTVGLLRPWRGSVTFDGRRMNGLNPERWIRAGVGFVPEPPGVFEDMPVLQNLRVGGFALTLGRRQVEERVEELFETFPKLRERADQRAGSLSGGERRVLAIARALMGRPRLLLVDEASMGLSPTAIAAVLDLMTRLRDQRMTLCMVEQHIGALDIADHAYLMEKGRIAHDAHGDLSDLRAAVTRTYLGGGRRRVRVGKEA